MEIEFDDDGWAAIHHCVAAEKELLMSIEKFVTTNEEYLEVETKDENQRTPLLLAVEKNKVKSVEKLLDLGARITATDAHMHGVVEICAMTENVEMLHHFIDMDDGTIKVWDKLIKFMQGNTEDESEKAAQILDRLTRVNEGESTCLNPHWQPFVQHKGIEAIVKVCKSSASDHVKGLNIAILNNIIRYKGVPDLLSKAGGLKVIVSFISRSLKDDHPAALNVIKEISALAPNLCVQIQDVGFVPIAVKIMNHPDKLSVNALSNAVLTLGHIAGVSTALQKSIGGTDGIFASFGGLFNHSQFQTCVPLLMALTQTIGKLVDGNRENQDLCINNKLAPSIIMVSRASKHRDLQTTTIDTLYRLSYNNSYASKHILDEGAVAPLMQILKKSRNLALQEAIALTLWSLAGPDINDKRSMVTLMGVNLLIEFLGAAGTSADNLNFIGAEGLGVLAQGAHNKQSGIAETNGIQPLVRQLRSSSSTVVTSVIRTLRHLCLGIGYVTNTTNQNIIAQSRGLKFLVALMAHSKAELIQVESAITLGAISLGNTENLASLKGNPDFSFLHMIRLLYSNAEDIRILAGTALATFSFNSILQQKEIAECGGVRWHNFASSLQSKNDYIAITAAFQVVVLSRIIPDEEPASSSSEGIKTLVTRLESTKDDHMRALAADCIARLAHTRAGVPAAMVSIKAIQQLCAHLQLNNEQVQGASAVALGYLSFDHTGERELLRLCREKPFLIHAIKYYSKNYKLSPAFLNGWKHCLHVGLPVKWTRESKDECMQNLTQNISNVFMKQPKELPSSFLVLTEDAGMSRTHSNHQSSRASQLLATIHDDASQMHARSTRSSRLTLSVQRHHTKHSSPLSQDIGPSISQQSAVSSVVIAE